MPSFLNPDTRSFFPTAVNTMAPATGTTRTLQSGRNMITGTGTIAALTLRMPANPYTGGITTIYPGVAVTALTLQTATGGAIAGAPTALAAGKPVSMMWNGTAWVLEVD